jgi:hypothetical protein
MSELERIIDRPQSLATALLKSARDEAPPAQAPARALAVMGISTVAASFVATSAAKAAVTVDVLKSTTLGAIAAAAKWTLVGVSAAALTVGAVRQYQAHTAGNAGQVSASLTPTPARNLPQRNEPLLAPAPVPSNSPAPSLPSTRATEPRTAKPSGATNVSEGPVARSLTEEVAALDKVRAAAQAHNPALMFRTVPSQSRRRCFSLKRSCRVARQPPQSRWPGNCSPPPHQARTQAGFGRFYPGSKNRRRPNSVGSGDSEP